MDGERDEERQGGYFGQPLSLSPPSLSSQTQAFVASEVGTIAPCADILPVLVLAVGGATRAMVLEWEI